MPLEDRIMRYFSWGRYGAKHEDPITSPVCDMDHQAGTAGDQQKILPNLEPDFSQEMENEQDWDQPLPTPKTRKKGTVSVRLHFQGRGKPLPFDES